jgi:hypothetical protein
MVILGLFGLLVYEEIQGRGIIKSASNGYDQEWKLQFLIISRMVMFPLFGVGLVLLGVGVGRWAERFFLAGIIALAINIASMLIIR